MNRTVANLASSESFLVYPENRFAYVTVTSLDGTVQRRQSPPLYLYGPSGCGKSHLLRHFLRVGVPAENRRRVICWTSSEFAANLAEAVQGQKIAEFQESCRRAEMLILEDLQALEGRTETQQQLLAIFDELLSCGAQLIFSSRKPPGELVNFPNRLVSRFHGAVLAQIKPPAHASRAGLLLHLAAARQIPLSADVAKLLAETFPVSPRELHGLLLQLENARKKNQSPLSLEFVRSFLKHDVPPRRTTLTEIAKSVAEHFHVPVARLRSRTRVQRLVLPRQCAMFLARELTGELLDKIGTFFGDRDHSTVVHACKRLQKLLSSEPEIRLHLSQIRCELGIE